MTTITLQKITKNIISLKSNFNNLQDDVTECKYGILNVRAYYNIKSKTLVIDGKYLPSILWICFCKNLQIYKFCNNFVEELMGVNFSEFFLDEMLFFKKSIFAHYY